MSIVIEQFIRKLNNTELNSQSTNDSYIRLSKEIQDFVPADFFKFLDSKQVSVINKGTNKEISADKWLRFQYYPSNKEYRIVSMTEIYEAYNPYPGDFVVIEKITDGSHFHYEVSMKKLNKLSMKFHKKSSSFEILNLLEGNNITLLDKDVVINYNGNDFDSKIIFTQRRKKREDSPTETDFYEILNIPDELLTEIDRDSFVEILKRGSKFYISVEKSWEFNKFER